MDEMRFQNKVSLSAVEFEALAEILKLKCSISNKMVQFSFKRNR
jgi:hypothetical protein